MIDCPYCGERVEINHDDGQGYAEDQTHQQDCPECEKTFVFTTSISFHYNASKADCLNGSEHTYKITNTCPKEFSRMCCTQCGHERNLTEQERILYKIGTKESYFEKLKTL